MKPLTAKAISERYGFTPRHWTRLAAAGKVPGAYQPGGDGGQWVFDSAMRRFDPSRPSQYFQCLSGFHAPRHIGHLRTIGTWRTHKSRHSCHLRTPAGLAAFRHIKGLRSRTWAKGGIDPATQFQEEPAP